MIIDTMGSNPDGNPQPSWRHSYNAHDQHKRQWLVVIEKKTMAPCFLNPTFTAPLVPPAKYVSLDPRMPYNVVIDYESWLTEVRAANREYMVQRMNVSRALYGERATMEGPPSLEVVNIIGQPPIQAELIEAARDGDPNALGLPVPEVPTPKPPKAKKAKPAVPEEA